MLKIDEKRSDFKFRTSAKYSEIHVNFSVFVRMYNSGSWNLKKNIIGSSFYKKNVKKLPCCNITSVYLTLTAKYWRRLTTAIMTSTLRSSAFSANEKHSSLKISMHLYCDVKSLCIFCALMLTWKVLYYWRRYQYSFIETLSKTGYWLRVCHGWFHLQRLPRPVRNASRAIITQNDKSKPTVGFEPVAFRLRSEGATTKLRALMSVAWIRVHLVLHVLLLEIYL